MTLALLPVPTALVAVHLYVPRSLSTVLDIVRLGVVTDPPLYLEDDPTTMASRPALATLYHVTDVALGLADITRVIVTESEV